MHSQVHNVPHCSHVDCGFCAVYMSPLHQPDDIYTPLSLCLSPSVCVLLLLLCCLFVT